MKFIHAIHAIRSVNGVNELHMLRSRRMGHNVLVDVHILVSPRLSVSEGHQISEAVEASLSMNFDDINDVTVHIDPEDDEHTENSCKHLPLRNEVMIGLQDHWSEISEAQELMDITLHYLDGSINLQLVLPLKLIRQGGDSKLIQQQIEIASKKLECIGSVEILYK